MRSSIIAGLFAATAAAWQSEDPCAPPPCMSLDQATQVANNFKELIADYSNATALAVLSPNYVDNTDSVAELINGGCPNGPVPLGQPTFTSRIAFMAAQGSQKPIPFDTLNIWYNCDTVALRWRTTPTPNATEIVTGIIILETEYQDSETQPWLITTSYSEFNSGAWLVDLGVFVPKCDAPSSAPPTKRDVPQLPGYRMA